MSSTDDSRPGAATPDSDDASLLIRDFFDSQLVPVGQRMRREEAHAFPVAADAARETYYTVRERTAMAPEDFEASAPEAVEDLVPALARLWDQLGTPELSALAPGLSRVATAVYLIQDPADELSPFVYVMF